MAGSQVASNCARAARRKSPRRACQEGISRARCSCLRRFRPTHSPSSQLVTLINPAAVVAAAAHLTSSVCGSRDLCRCFLPMRSLALSSSRRHVCRLHYPRSQMALSEAELGCLKRVQGDRTGLLNKSTGPTHLSRQISGFHPGLYMGSR